MEERKLKPHVNKNDDEISLKEIIVKMRRGIKYLKSQWKILAIVSIIGGLMGLGYAIIKKPLYTAVLTFALDDTRSSGGLGGYSSLASQFGFDFGGGGSGAFVGDNLIELMKSRSMVNNTLLSSVYLQGKKTTLAELFIAFNHYRDNWSKNPELNKIHFLPGADRTKFTLKQDSILGTFYKQILSNNLGVDKIDKKLSIINVVVTSKNELFSKYFAEILVDQVSKFYVETKTKKSKQNVDILQHQTDSVRRELNQAINGVASSVDVNPNANPYRQILRTPSQHKQVDVQVNTAILAELVKNLEVSKVSLRNETPLIQIIDRPILPLDVKKVGKLISIVIGFILGCFFSSIYLATKKAFEQF